MSEYGTFDIKYTAEIVNREEWVKSIHLPHTFYAEIPGKDGGKPNIR